MAEFLPLATIQAMYKQETGDVFPLVVTIDDETFDDPLYLTDTAVHRLSVDPLLYGFQGLHDYVFAVTGLLLPDLKPGSPVATTLIIDNIEADYRSQLAAATDPRVSIAMVMGSQPTTLLYPRTGLYVTGRAYDEESVTLAVSNRRVQGHGGENVLDPFIKHRQTRSVSPGLHR
jgi:hypothetical protein